MYMEQYIRDTEADPRYACNYCTYSSTNLGALKDHIIRRHSDAYPYKCKVPKCNYRAKIIRDLRTHRKNLHTIVPHVSCPFEGCNFKGKFNKDLKQHKSNCHNPNRKKVFDCPLCSQKFFKAAQVRQHLMTHTKEKPWRCSVCSYESKSKGHLQRHVETHHGKLGSSGDKKILTCDSCNFTTVFKERMKSHIYSHSTELPYACSFPGCSYRSKWRRYVEVHEIRNHAPEEHACPYPHCKYVGTHSRQLRYHVAGVHKKPFRCAFPECNRRFNTEPALINHQRLHDPGRQLQCEHCSLRFATKNSFNSHVRFAHTETEGPLLCPHCAYRTDKRACLRSHLKRIHKAEDRICSEPGCNYRSCSPYDMTDHRERHNPASHPLKCGYCPYRFIHITSLIKHEQKKHIHTAQQVTHKSASQSDPGATPQGLYSCNICESNFMEEVDSNKHYLLQRVAIVILAKLAVEFL